MAIASFRDLRVWQQGIDFSEKIYLVTQNFPQEERYGVVSQMRRAAVSVPSNIAEGYMRGATKEYVYHLRVALGSLAELETQIIIAGRLHFVPQSECEELIKEIHTMGRMLNVLKAKLIPKTQILLPAL